MKTYVWLCWHNDCVEAVFGDEERAKSWMRTYVVELEQRARDNGRPIKIRRVTDHKCTSDSMAGARIEIEPRVVR
jgi:hypothetical protein